MGDSLKIQVKRKQLAQRLKNTAVLLLMNRKCK